MKRSARICRNLAVLFLLAALTFACKPAGKELTVLFADGKGIAKADKVYQSGIVIGTVRDVGIKDGRAAVRIRIDSDKWTELKPPLACYIDIDPANSTHAAMLVRGLGDLGGELAVTLQENAIIDGVDSYLVWQVLHFARNVTDPERSDFWRYIKKQTGGN